MRIFTTAALTAVLTLGSAATLNEPVVWATDAATLIKEPVVQRWTPRASRSYAMKQLGSYGWTKGQWKCLDNLWTRESNWRHRAWNKIKVNGKHAGGIPQILGLDPKKPVPYQIARGMDYIKGRYGSPCAAWQHSENTGWY